MGENELTIATAGFPRQFDKLVFVEYMLSLRASSQTGVAIPRMNGTR